MKKIIFALAMILLLMVTSVSAYTFRTAAFDFDNTDQMIDSNIILMEEGTNDVMIERADTIAEFEVEPDTMYYTIYAQDGWSTDVDAVFFDSRIESLDTSVQSHTLINGEYETVCDMGETHNAWYCIVTKEDIPLSFKYDLEDNKMKRANFLKQNGRSYYYLFATEIRDKDTNNQIDGTVKILDLEKDADPMALIITKANTEFEVLYTAPGYKDDIDAIYFDERLTTCDSSEGTCLLEDDGRGFRTEGTFFETGGEDRWEFIVYKGTGSMAFDFYPDFGYIIITNRLEQEDEPTEYHAPEVNLLDPDEGDVWYGEKTVDFEIFDEDGDLYQVSVKLFKEGDLVETLYDSFPSTSDITMELEFDSTQYVDGVYEIQVHAWDEQELHSEDSASFIIDNVEGEISVILIQPNGGEVLSDEYEIKWTAEDDGSELLIDIFYSEYEDEWIMIDSEMENDGTYMWDTTEVEDGEYRIMVIAREPSTFLDIYQKLFEYFDLVILGGYDISDDEFTIDNYNDGPYARLDIYPDDRVPLGTQVILDGSNSYDPDPDDSIEAYEFFQELGPIINVFELLEEDGSVIAFVPDKIGRYEFCLMVYDGDRWGGDCEDVFVYDPNPATEEEKPEIEKRDIFVNQMNANGNQVYFKPGEMVNLDVTLTNSREEDIDKASVQIMIPKMGFIKRFGPFEMEEDDLVTKKVQFKIPENVAPGTYELRTVITTGTDQRVKVRRIKII